MKTAKIVLIFFSLIISACDDSDSPVKPDQLTVDEVVEFSLFIEGVQYWDNDASSRMLLTKDLDFATDSLEVIGDTLYAYFPSAKRLSNAYAKLALAEDKKTLAYAKFYFDNRWTYYWYDYSKMKWEDGYYNSESVVSFFEMNLIDTLAPVSEGFWELSGSEIAPKFDARAQAKYNGGDKKFWNSENYPDTAVVRLRLAKE